MEVTKEIRLWQVWSRIGETTKAEVGLEATGCFEFSPRVHRSLFFYGILLLNIQLADA